MNIKSLLVSFALVAATSTAALARPASYGVSADASFSIDAAFSIGGSSVTDHRNAQPVVRDHRDTRGSVKRPIMYRPIMYRPIAYRPQTNNTKLFETNGHRWSEYTGPIHARGGYGFSAITDATRIGQVRQDFWLKGAPATTIQLRAVAGSTFVTSVLVEYGPGTQPQVVQINRDLRDGAITIDLAGNTRAVSRIGVSGTSGARASYQIFAR